MTEFNGVMTNLLASVVCQCANIPVWPLVQAMHDSVQIKKDCDQNQNRLIS